MNDRRQIRKDPLTGRWVVVTDWSEQDPTLRLDPSALEAGQRVGVVAGASPIFDRRQRVDRGQDPNGLHQWMSAAGEHEVIYEDQDRGWADLPLDQLTEILIVYRERMRLLSDDNRFRQLVLVKRHGQRAGARTTASHAELFALTFVPDELRQRLVAFSGHQRRGGTCVLCDELQALRADRSRFVDETLRHLVYCPWAPSRAFELVVAPKGHHGDFRITADAELSDLGRALQGSLQRLKIALEDPAYRMVLYTAPIEAGADQGHFHWHMVLQPELDWPSTLSPVVELCPIPPEVAAARLREVSFE